MIVSKISNLNKPVFTNGNNQTKKNSLLDNLHNYARNSADMTDNIVVPRTIFKGYLGIMAGTTFMTLGGLLNGKKFPKISKTLTAIGLLTSLYGTWAFVRPFIIKDAPGVNKPKV